MLNIYQIPIYVLTPLKLNNETVSKMTKKEEPLNFNHAVPSEVKSLACLVSLC